MATHSLVTIPLEELLMQPAIALRNPAIAEAFVRLYRNGWAVQAATGEVQLYTGSRAHGRFDSMKSLSDFVADVVPMQVL